MLTNNSKLPIHIPTFMLGNPSFFENCSPNDSNQVLMHILEGLVMNPLTTNLMYHLRSSSLGSEPGGLPSLALLLLRDTPPRTHMPQAHPLILPMTTEMSLFLKAHPSARLCLTFLAVELVMRPTKVQVSLSISPSMCPPSRAWTPKECLRPCGIRLRRFCSLSLEVSQDQGLGHKRIRGWTLLLVA